MALLRTLIGLLAVIALTVAPACALSAAPFGLAYETAHHDGGAPPHCIGGGEEPSEAATALCAFFCGFFLVPDHLQFAADFEPPGFDSVTPALTGEALRPPAPPPRV